MAKRSVWDRMRTAFKAKDEAAFEEELQNAIEANEDGPEGSPPVVVHVHNAPGENPVSEADKAAADEGGADPMAALVATVEKISARLDAIEAGVAKNAEAEANEVETTDEASGDDDKSESDVQEEKSADKPVMDSAALRNSFTDTLAKAEILSPGVKLPVFDAKKSRKLTIDAMCDVRKRALSAALKDDARKVHVLKVVGGAAPDVSKMTCDTAAIVFNAASELARVANNAGAAAEHRPELRTGPMTAVKYAEMLAARRKKNA